MAQGEDIQTTSDTTNAQKFQNPLHFKGPKPQTSLTFQQLLQSDGSKWSDISSQIKKKNQDQEDDGNRHNKKSVLAKVKEAAKKLKLLLKRKKHSEKNESLSPATRSSLASRKDKGEGDAEYHSERMYESKHTSATNKQSLVSTSGKHLEKLNNKKNKDQHAPSDPTVPVANTDTINQTATPIDVPVPDKGVSVKEYLMHKFEPGEDERALSKVITQTISPRRDKMREAMSSFLKNDESSKVNSSNADNNLNHNFKSKSLPTTSTNTTNIGSNIAPIKQSYSLNSNASKASMDLNQTFKSTFASYQSHFLGSSSNAFSPLGHASNGNETRAPVSSVRKTRVPSHTATSVRRVPVSRPKQTQNPSHTETNSIQVQPSSRTDCNATRTPVSTGDQG